MHHKRLMMHEFVLLYGNHASRPRARISRAAQEAAFDRAVNGAGETGYVRRFAGKEQRVIHRLGKRRHIGA